jgi:methylated-DNA-[protein]-cysteine S-methyltransferase
MSISIQYYKTPFGELILGAFNGHLCLADWRYRKMRAAVDNRIQKELTTGYVEEDQPVLAETRRQLDEYFHEGRQQFDLPVLFIGTEFQQSVWRTLMTVSYGSTATYLQLSDWLGNRDAIRAVASANGANAISIIVPCHRIIGSDGDLTGYAGGLPAKKGLLMLENEKFDQKAGAQLAFAFE